jgi:thioredoxin reductase (NADPH)
MTWWPRNTSFFSTTERLAIAGAPIQNNHQGRITGEDYIAYLRGVVEQFDLPIRSYEPVVDIIRHAGGFELVTQPQTGEQRTRARRVVLAIGDMHYPNFLNIPGEDLPHVSHYFHDPHDYFRRRLLIVGGKNSAVEAALRCWRAGAQVTISYRRASFDQERVKHWLLPDLLAQIEAGNIGFLPETLPLAITRGSVEFVPLRAGVPQPQELFARPTDFVLLATGFHGDQRLLQTLGVELQGLNRVPVFDPLTMESNVQGIFLAGTVAAGIQQRYTLFIENCHEHAAKIATAITGDRTPAVGDVAQRSYELTLEQIKAN